jgi:hypothetical protein
MLTTSSFVLAKARFVGQTASTAADGFLSDDTLISLYGHKLKGLVVPGCEAETRGNSGGVDYVPVSQKPRPGGPIGRDRHWRCGASETLTASKGVWA